MGRWSGLRSGCTHASRLGVESASRRVRRTCGHDLLRPDVRGAAALSQGSRGFDFTGYKRSSLMRRVDRRMAQVAVAEYSDYLDYLQVHPEEFTGLFNTILINVTGFFRDPDAWEYLRTAVLPAVLAGRGSDGPSGSGAPVAHPARRRTRWRCCWPRRSGWSSSGCGRRSTPPTSTRRASSRPGTRPMASATSGACRPRCWSATSRSVATGTSSARTCALGHLRPQRPRPGRADIADRPAGVPQHADVLQRRDPARILTRFHFALADGGVLFLGKAEMLLSHTNLFLPLDLKRRVFHKMPPDAAGQPHAPRRAAPAAPAQRAGRLGPPAQRGLPSQPCRPDRGHGGRPGGADQPPGRGAVRCLRQGGGSAVPRPGRLLPAYRAAWPHRAGPGGAADGPGAGRGVPADAGRARSPRRSTTSSASAPCSWTRPTRSRRRSSPACWPGSPWWTVTCKCWCGTGTCRSPSTTA